MEKASDGQRGKYHQTKRALVELRAHLRGDRIALDLDKGILVNDLTGERLLPSLSLKGEQRHDEEIGGLCVRHHSSCATTLWAEGRITGKEGEEIRMAMEKHVEEIIEMNGNGKYPVFDPELHRLV